MMIKKAGVSTKGTAETGEDTEEETCGFDAELASVEFVVWRWEVEICAIGDDEVEIIDIDVALLPAVGFVVNTVVVKGFVVEAGTV